MTQSVSRKMTSTKQKEDRKPKWICYLCGEVANTKRNLIDHVKLEFEEGNDQAAVASDQLEELGVKNLYE